ncbi:MAG: copper resistance protein B [Burkholderiaceae bacterium]|nr:copper resistance protein B [Burkholderiaceae bacterium]
MNAIPEINANGKDDRTRAIGSGSSDVESGLRLRYKIARQFALISGSSGSASWETPRLRARRRRGRVRYQSVAGVRIWF